MTIPDEMPLAEDAPVPARSCFSLVLRRFRRDPVAVAAALVLLLIVALTLLAPWIAPADPYEAGTMKRLLPVGTAGHLLGTDELGRDLLSRLLHGGRLSLLIGVLPMLAAFVVGMTAGLLAGYLGGVVHGLVMRTTAAFLAVPSTLLVLAVLGALGPGPGHVLIALTLVFTPQVLHVAASVSAQVCRQDHVDAARLSGDSALGIIRHHVLGHVLGPVAAHAIGLAGVGLILASVLSLLGLGLGGVSPEPEWGLMLSTRQPLQAVLPAVMILLTALALRLLGDGILSAVKVKP